MSSPLHRSLPLALAVCVGAVLLPARAGAQFGALARRIAKQRAQDAVEKTLTDSAKGRDSSAAAPAAPAAPHHAVTMSKSGRREPPYAATPAGAGAPPREPTVLPITAEVLDRAIQGMSAEHAQALRRKAPPPKVDPKDDEVAQWYACVQKIPGGQPDNATAKAKCGATMQEAMQQLGAHQQRLQQEQDARDSLRIGVGKGAPPDSAGVVAGHFRDQYQWGITKERITAFLVQAGSESRASCMRARRLPYTFTADETSALKARQGELAKLFLDPDLIRGAAVGRCARA